MQVVRLDVRQEIEDPAPRLVGGSSTTRLTDPTPAPAIRGKVPDRLVVEVKANVQLPDVVVALQLAGRLARFLHRREHQANQQADNRDNDQEFDERHSATVMIIATHRHGWSLCGLLTVVGGIATSAGASRNAAASAAVT